MPPPATRSGNLPADTSSFIGRREEMAQTRRKLAAARLVTLVGPGGVGKTRLAIRMASDLGRGFADGAWLVELAELQDPGLVGNTVLAALDLRDQAGVEPAALLGRYLKHKQLLIVLDNCEHQLAPVARLVSEILQFAPGVRVLATSREPLSVAGEHVQPIPALQLPSPLDHLDDLLQNDAVRLFVERAAAASGEFALTVANHAAVSEVCRRLDGLPLAIELAAVRTRALTPEQIRDRLSRRFELLTGGSRAALPRHQTLRTAIEWSYELLGPEERLLLAKLCVFAGRFTLADVEAVCSSGTAQTTTTLDLLSSLVDKSLVTKDDAGGSSLYHLHETMREYARMQLRAGGEEAAVEGCCADYYLQQCRAFAAVGRYRLLEWLAWMDPEIDNVRAVLQRCLDQQDVQRGIEIATSLVWYWVTRATTEGVRWMDELLTAAPAEVTNPWVYFVRGFLAVVQTDLSTATTVLDRAVAAARAARLPDVLSQSLAMASIAAKMSDDHESSKRLLAEAEGVSDAANELGATLMMQQARALNGLVDGDLDAAVSAASEGARLSRDAGDLYSLGMMLMNHGFAALLSGSVLDAEQQLTDSLRIASDVDDRVAQCYLLGGLGCCAAWSRDPRLAAQLLGAMDNLRAEVGANVNVGFAPAFTTATASSTAALGTARFEREFQTGQQLHREAAIRLALHEKSPTTTRVSAPRRAAPLTQRETEVAQLVADGLSNKAIGARLFLSERTVESHVRNILNRLGFSSRAQIAGWVTTVRP